MSSNYQKFRNKKKYHKLNKHVAIKLKNQSKLNDYKNEMENRVEIDQYNGTHTFEERQDSELFFFDICGNKDNLDTVLPHGDRVVASTDSKSRKKKKKKKHVNEAKTSKIKADTLRNIKNSKNDVPGHSAISLPEIRKKKKKKQRAFELKEIVSPEQSTDIAFNIENENTFGKMKSKSHKETLLGIGDEHSEMINYSKSGHEKKEKIRKKRSRSNITDSSVLEVSQDINESKLNEYEENNLSGSLLYTKKKKKNHTQRRNEEDTLKNPETSMTQKVPSFEEPTPIKRKKKKHKVNAESTQTSECKKESVNVNCSDIKIEENNTLDNKLLNITELNIQKHKSSSSESELLEQLREDVLYLFKKKKRKKNLEKETDKESINSTEYGKHNSVFNKKDTSDLVDNSLKSPRKHKSKKGIKEKALNDGIEIDNINLKDVICNTNNIVDNNNLLTKGKNKYLDNDAIEIDSMMNRFVTSDSGIQSSDSSHKKKKKKHKITDSIKIDSDSEHIIIESAITENVKFNNVEDYADYSPSKKKRKRELENELLEIVEGTPKKTSKKARSSDEKPEDYEVILPSSVAETKRKKSKHKNGQTDIVVEIRDSDCEMTSSCERRGKKKKEKRDNTELNNTKAESNPGELLGVEDSENFKKKHKKKNDGVYNEDTDKNNWDVSNSDLHDIVSDKESTPKNKRRKHSTNDEETKEIKINLSSSFEDEIKKKSKHKDVKVDIRGNECEMPSFCSSSGMKKKKKMDKQEIEDDSKVDSTSEAEEYSIIRNNAGIDIQNDGINNCDIPNRVFEELATKSDRESCGEDTDQNSNKDNVKKSKKHGKIHERKNEHLMVKKDKNENLVSEEYHIEDAGNETKNEKDWQHTKDNDDSGTENLNISHVSGSLCESEDSDVEMENEVEKLRRLDIHLPFTVPPLHSILTRTTYPTKEQLEEIKMQHLDVKSGPFSKEENEKILANWKKFCKEYGFRMNPNIFINFPQKVPIDQKMQFLRYLSHGLDNRLLHRVHIRFKALVMKSKGGRFTTEEDHKILDFMKTTSSHRPFADLAELLGRTRLAVEKRHRRLISNQSGTIHWTPELINAFLTHLQNITKCREIKEFEHREITLEEWKKLSEKMDPIPVAKLQVAWKNTIYPRLFVEENVDLRKIKERIIKRLIKKKQTDWRTVDWKKIAKKFHGFTPTKIYMMFKQLVIFHVPKKMQPNLKDSLDFLNDKLVKYNVIPTPHKFKKIDYTNLHTTDKDR